MRHTCLNQKTWWCCQMGTGNIEQAFFLYPHHLLLLHIVSCQMNIYHLHVQKIPSVLMTLVPLRYWLGFVLVFLVNFFTDLKQAQTCSRFWTLCCWGRICRFDLGDVAKRCIYKYMRIRYIFIYYPRLFQVMAFNDVFDIMFGMIRDDRITDPTQIQVTSKHHEILVKTNVWCQSLPPQSMEEKHNSVPSPESLQLVFCL